MNRPEFIKETTFNDLDRKTQDFIYFIYVEQLSKDQIKRKLYITSERQWQRYRTKVWKIIQNDKMS